MSRGFMFDGFVAVCGVALALLAGGVDEARAGEEVQELTASDAGSTAHFGYSVSVFGDTTVVGTDGDDCDSGTSCGAAYVFGFDGTTWVEEQKLTASDAADDDHFGRSVSVFGGTIVVGASNADGAAENDCGSAYVYRFDGATWVEEHKLTASDADDFDYFGYSLSLIGQTVVVGASGGESAYVFRFDGDT